MLEPVFLGFLARRVAERPDFLAAAPIDDVCSVSECISPGAPDRVQRWAHNAASCYDTEALAWSVVPPAERDAYTMFAYRAGSIRFDDGDGEPWSPRDAWPGLPAEPDLSAYRSIGYDVVGCSAGAAFDCSPLSCNGVGNQHAVNRHCLVDDVDVAMALGRAFTRADSGVEPGPYHVVEVLRRA
jgi:hypothetical protein